MDNAVFLPVENFQVLLDALREQGYRVLGPRVEDGTIRIDEIRDADAMPIGIESDQSPGRYRLRQAEHRRRFAWAAAAQTLKPLTFAPREDLWTCRRDDDGRLSFERCEPVAESLAVIGVRACDLAAMKLQRQHFLAPGAEDPWFRARFGALFIVAVHCATAADTCFCAATGDGPVAARNSFDLALHELDDGYICEAGSYDGEKLLQGLALKNATPAQLQAAEAQSTACAQSQQRSLPDEIPAKLMQSLEHPYWERVGERCLSCGNCTAVCPSCFCHQQHDEITLADASAGHYRAWSSCFTHNHGYIAGHRLRPTPAKRYRQWLTHKFATWHDQFGRSGCTGCGRCIAWCPVGIDVTAELAALCEGAE